MYPRANIMICDMIYAVFLALTIVDTIMMLSQIRLYLMLKKVLGLKRVNSLSLLVHFEIHSVTEERSTTT